MYTCKDCTQMASGINRKPLSFETAYQLMQHRQVHHGEPLAVSAEKTMIEVVEEVLRKHNLIGETSNASTRK